MASTEPVPDAHSDTLVGSSTASTPVNSPRPSTRTLGRSTSRFYWFGECPIGVAQPEEGLGRQGFEREAKKLARMFQKASALYERDVEEKVRSAGPQI